MEKEHKGKNKIWVLLAVIFASVALISAGMLIGNKLIEIRASKALEDLTEQTNDIESPVETDTHAPDETGETAETEAEKPWSEYTLDEKYQAYYDTYGIEVPRKNIDFEDLKANTNADIYAWLYVPGTNVDYPVVQHPTDDSYYLDYNLDGSKGYPGGTYTELCNSKDFSDRLTVIYGHYLKNGKAFGSLHNFEDETVFEENRYIYVYTPDDILVYEIFTAREASDVHLIKGYEWDDESWVEYLNEALKASAKDDHSIASYDFDADDKVLTLSTCMRNAPSKRYLVQGVLLDEAR